LIKKNKKTTILSRFCAFCKELSTFSTAPTTTITLFIYNIIYSISSMNSDIDNNAIKELGLNHVKNAYNKINKESGNGQSKEKKHNTNIPQDEKRQDPQSSLDLHHAVRLAKAGFIMYYQKRDLPLYLKQVINPLIDIWEISAHTVVDQYAKDVGLNMKPEYICFGGGVLLCLDPILQAKKGKLKNIFQQNNEDIDKTDKKSNNIKKEDEVFTPEIVDYDLPKNKTGGGEMN
jgi:hypothetical protein